MYKLGLVLIASFVTSGCESVWIVPPSNGRVVDARSRQPVVQAAITRVCKQAPAKTKTDADGHFNLRGKRRLQIALGDTLCAPVSYRIEAAGYQSVETNRFAFRWANQSGMRDNLGEIQIVPK
jgi:hypothetical protein